MAFDDFSKINVIDIGGRYGVHSTWSDYEHDINYILFEVDPDEFIRLREKYSSTQKSVEVVPLALGNTQGTMDFNLMRHRGLSSAKTPDPNSIWRDRPHWQDAEIEQSIVVETSTIDAFCSQRGISVDFLKIDTEGSEFEVLEGGAEQLSSAILGIRAEVAFGYIYRDSKLFTHIHELLLEKGFFLLNFDYNGKGHHFHEIADANRYGALICTDAVWLRSFDFIFSSDHDHDEKAARILKCALFCLSNNAADVAIDLLLTGKNEHGFLYHNFIDSPVARHVDTKLRGFLKKISSAPGYSAEKLEATYSQIFEKKLHLDHRFWDRNN